MVVLVKYYKGMLDNEKRFSKGKTECHAKLEIKRTSDLQSLEQA